jgi:hypothetical protein
LDGGEDAGLELDHDDRTSLEIRRDLRHVCDEKTRLTGSAPVRISPQADY